MQRFLEGQALTHVSPEQHVVPRGDLWLLIVLWVRLLCMKGCARRAECPCKSPVFLPNPRCTLI